MTDRAEKLEWVKQDLKALHHEAYTEGRLNEAAVYRAMLREAEMGASHMLPPGRELDSSPAPDPESVRPSARGTR